jgi:hypothetical protein
MTPRCGHFGYGVARSWPVSRSWALASLPAC